MALSALLAAAPFSELVSAQEAPQLQITSKEYIVIDADTGEVFAQRGADDKVAIASLTKVYTAIEALELAPSFDMTMTTDQSDVFDDSSTRMGFGAGETFTLKDLFYGMLVPSGNDAAHAIARNLGKELQPSDTDQQAVNYFVTLTNERIRDMGLTETHLVNPHGWGVPGHYSSAHDLAAFMRYAVQYPRFMQAISTMSYTTANGDYSFNNSNRMLNEGMYPGLIGGKTGYDDDAGYCLISVARRDGSTMIAVTLNGVAPDDWYDDDIVLLDYAFQQKAKRVAAGRPISGEILTYRDPDAAAIAQDATSGGSLGGAASGKAAAANAGKAAADSVPGRSGKGDGSDGQAGGIGRTRLGTGLHFLAVLAVAVLVIVAGAFGTIRRGSRRSTAGSLRHVAESEDPGGP